MNYNQTIVIVITNNVSPVVITIGPSPLTVIQPYQTNMVQPEPVMPFSEEHVVPSADTINVSAANNDSPMSIDEVDHIATELVSAAEPTIALEPVHELASIQNDNDASDYSDIYASDDSDYSNYSDRISNNDDSSDSEDVVFLAEISASTNNVYTESELLTLADMGIFSTKPIVPMRRQSYLDSDGEHYEWYEPALHNNSSTDEESETE